MLQRTRGALVVLTTAALAACGGAELQVLLEHDWDDLDLNPSRVEWSRLRLYKLLASRVDDSEEHRKDLVLKMTSYLASADCSRVSGASSIVAHVDACSLTLQKLSEVQDNFLMSDAEKYGTTGPIRAQVGHFVCEMAAERQRSEDDRSTRGEAHSPRLRRGALDRRLLPDQHKKKNSVQPKLRMEPVAKWLVDDHCKGPNPLRKELVEGGRAANYGASRLSHEEDCEAAVAFYKTIYLQEGLAPIWRNYSARQFSERLRLTEQEESWDSDRMPSVALSTSTESQAGDPKEREFRREPAPNTPEMRGEPGECKHELQVMGSWKTKYANFNPSGLMWSDARLYKVLAQHINDRGGQRADIVYNLERYLNDLDCYRDGAGPERYRSSPASRQEACTRTYQKLQEVKGNFLMEDQQKYGLFGPIRAQVGYFLCAGAFTLETAHDNGDVEIEAAYMDRVMQMYKWLSTCHEEKIPIVEGSLEVSGKERPAGISHRNDCAAATSFFEQYYPNGVAATSRPIWPLFTAKKFSAKLGLTGDGQDWDEDKMPSVQRVPTRTASPDVPDCDNPARVYGPWPDGHRELSEWSPPFSTEPVDF